MQRKKLAFTLAAAAALLHGTAVLAQNGSFMRPIAGGSIACSFDTLRCYTRKYHTGIDYWGEDYAASDILASSCGVVTLVQRNGDNDHGMGNAVVLRHKVAGASPGEVLTYYTLYAHMASLTPGLAVNQPVARGQKLGVMGASGYGQANKWGTTPHLHFEVKTANTLGNPTGAGAYWGYTPKSAANYGYLNPADFVSRRDAICTPGDPPPPTPPARPSVAVIKKNNTGTGKTELHVLSGPDSFLKFALNTATAQPPSGGEHVYRMADWDNDGKADLFAIKKFGTGTQSTEVHVLSGASNFQQYLLHTGTPEPETGSNYDFALADWNRDGKVDLFLIKKFNTGTQSTEVHILSGASNFQSFLLHTGTPQEQTGGNYDFATGDWNRDGRVDLFVIKKSATGTNSTEVHVLSGATNFQTFILHTGTAQPEVGSEHTYRVGDWDGDRVPDLFGIKQFNTGTGSTEVHVLSGAQGFRQFLLHTGTVQEQTGSNYDFEVIRYP